MNRERMLVLLLWTLLFRGGDFEEIGCPRECTCSENEGSTGWAIRCTLLSAIPKFPQNSTNIYVHTTASPNIESGTFINLKDVGSIMITGRLGTIKKGAFRNITGRKTGSTKNQELSFVEVQILKIESGAFEELSGFSSFRFTTFSVKDLESQAFAYFRDIEKIVFRSGSFNQIPSASLKGFHDIGEILFWDITASTLKARVFEDSKDIGNITFLNSTLGMLEADALGYINCLGGLHIISCHVGDFRSFALFGLNNVDKIEITNTQISKRTDRILEGIGRVAVYDLQPDISHLKPEQGSRPSPDCFMPKLEAADDDVMTEVIVAGVCMAVVLIAILACCVIFVRGLLNGYLCVPSRLTTATYQLHKTNRMPRKAQPRKTGTARAGVSRVQKSKYLRPYQFYFNPSYEHAAADVHF